MRSRYAERMSNLRVWMSAAAVCGFLAVAFGAFAAHGVTDPKAIEAFEGRIRAAQNAGVTGTPKFFVNGVEIITPGGEGASMEDLSRAIEAELAK